MPGHYTEDLAMKYDMPQDDKFAKAFDEFVDDFIADNPTLEYADQFSALRMVGWALTNTVVSGMLRNSVVDVSRILHRKDAFFHNAISIYESYVIGSGLSTSFTNQASVSKNNKQQTLLENFRKSADNRTVFRFQGQAKSYRDLLVEGESHFLIFHGGAGTTPLIRHLEDSEEFLEPICHPDDYSIVLYHVRRFMPIHYEFSVDYIVPGNPSEVQVQYIRDWMCTDEMLRSAHIKLPKEGYILPRAFCVRAQINETLGRGYPLGESAMPWARAYKGFLEDRVQITRSLAKFTWKLKGDMDPARISQIMGKMAQDQMYDFPGQHSGNTMITTPQLDLAPVGARSGGSDARADGRGFRQALGSGFGLTEPNLTGDPSVGNLASLTQMDGVMLRNFAKHQTLMLDINKDILACVLTQGKTTGKAISDAISWVDQFVTLSYPPIISADVASRASALISMAGRVPDKWLTEELLRTAGERDPDKVIEEYGMPTPPPLGGIPPKAVPGTAGSAQSVGGENPATPQDSSTPES